MKTINENKQQYFPLTHAQKRIYYEERRHPGTSWANNSFVVKYKEKIDFSLLSKAINFVIKKNDGLRLRIIEFDYNPEPLQYVSSYKEIFPDFFDFSGMDCERNLNRWLSRVKRKPFDLLDNNLFYFALIKYNENESGYLLSLHHCISDGGTCFIVMEAINELYEKLERGEKIDEKLCPSYLQYIVDEQEYLESDQAKIDKKFWHNKFLPFPKEIDISSRKGNPDNIKANNLVLTFPAKVRTMMHEYRRVHKASLFKLIISAFSIYLFRLTGLDDIVISTFNHGRNKEIHKKMAGMFTSTILFRLSIIPNVTFDSLIKLVGKEINHILKNHQQYPFDLIATEIKETSGSDLNSLRNIILAAHIDIEKKKFEYDHVFPSYEPGALFIHINISNKDKDGILELEWIYQVERFFESDIRRIHQVLVNILEDALISSGKKISEIELLSPEEKNQILYEFNNTKIWYPEDKTIFELFEDQVEQNPDYISVICEEKHLSYKKLDDKINRLAALLRKKGIGPDKIVGIMVSRSLEMMIALAAVLKAGGAYVPIDPEYPIERIKFYLLDSNATILLTQKDIIDKFGENGFNADTIDLFDDGIYDKNMTKPVFLNSPDDLAYIIFTSGSTGKPKGVMIRHRNAVNFFQGMAGKIEFSPDKTILALTTVSFDIFLLETLLPLTLGLRVVVANEMQQKDPGLLKEVIIKNSVNLLQATPSRLKLLLRDRNDFDCLQNLKELLVGGEPFPGDLFENLNKYFNGKIINVYGPTETTVWSTLSDLTGKKQINIGTPIANTQIYIVDKSMRLQPIGAIGELFIGGDGVARGYLNRPELTPERFVENPFVSVSDQYRNSFYTQIYQTGDLARWLPEGKIECLGRIDHQVKIRGFRIEEGEIENHIIKQNVQKIKETVVMAREDASGEKYLCAYLVSDEKIDITRLENTLAQTLLDYMIPSYFIQIEHIPLTPNGKIDRKSLPEPEIKEKGEYYIPPRNAIEKQLVNIWSEILHIEEYLIGIDDNFFKLGGHSLRAAVMIAMIHKLLNVKILMHEVFNMPSIRKLTEKIKATREEKYVSIEPAVKKDYYPLSSAQKRLYILNLMEGTNITYNMPILYILEEEPDQGQLEHVFAELIQRQESFRTSFLMIDNQPVQQIHETVNFEIEYFQIRSLVIRVSESKVLHSNGERLIENIMRGFIRPFNLSQAPLLRVGLLRTGRNKCLLMVDMHHVISDGLSFEIFKRELVELYESKQLPPLTIQYKDYSEWQIKEISREKLKFQEDYWINTLREKMPVLNLPLDFERPAVQCFDGYTIFFELGEKDTAALKELAKNENVTLFMMLFSLLNILLRKLSGQGDIVIGTPVAGRRHKELENLIGIFINTLALRNYPYGEKEFSEFLNEVKISILEAFENQDYPFEELVDLLNPDRDVSRNPLFDVMFALQIKEAENTKKQNKLKLNPFKYRRTVSRFDLTFFAEETEEGVFIELEYCTKLFKQKTIEKFISYFRTIILSVLKNPGKKIGEIEVLSHVEKNQLLYEFNETEVNYAKNDTIHKLFETQVEKTPAKTAVVFRKERLSYKELNEKANQLATLLRDKGVGPDKIVGIMVSRSLPMMVALLSVLKAGGAYVPIDPEYPIDRIKFYLQDSQANILLTQQDIIDKFAESASEVETIDLFDESVYNEIRIKFSNFVSVPHDLAYVIYTSGSTGKPKGVMIRHRNAINFFKGMTDKIDFSPQKTILALTTVSFDIFLLETLLPLTTGSKVIIADEHEQKDPELLKNVISGNNVNLLQATPSRLKLLLSSGDDFTYLNNLESILVGGEPFPKNLFEDLKKKFNGKIIDVYGPTETTVWSTLKDLTGQKEINIGNPIANTEVYILDRFMKLQPIGVVGELYIGGDGMARGYLNHPELTAERFVKNPFEVMRFDKPYTKIYCTGDLARWLPKGEIDFLGRIDHQVKIRGFRIETGEIENHIIRQTDQKIKEAVVMAREDTAGEKYLCAYIVADERVDIIELGNTLSFTLLDYMIPSYFVQIEKIPLTPNGKVDRKMLPDPNIKAKGENYEAPRNNIEEKLVEIWADLLYLKKDIIGIDDNFFKLGGHSLKAAIIITIIHKVFNVKVSMHEIFNNSTIRKLAGLIIDATKQEFTSITLAEEKEYYPQTSPQKRLFFVDQLEEAGTVYNMQLMDVYCKGIEKEALEDAVKKLIKRHDSMRTSFFTQDGNAVQKIHKFEEVGRDFTIEYYEMSENEMISARKQGDEHISGRDMPFKDLKELIEHFVRPFDLTQPPLLRVGLIKIWGNTKILMLDMHHIISDGVSLVIFLNDLWELYEDEDLSPLQVQYKDFAQWITHDKQKAVIKKQEEYWLNKFVGELAVLNLPYDYPRPAQVTFDGDMLHFEVGKRFTKKLNTMAQEQEVTLYMILMATYSILLSKLSGQGEIIMGTVTAGRDHADIQGLIGMFVNTLAIRTNPEGDKTFLEFLGEVKEHILAAFENLDYPFEELVSKVSSRVDVSRNPVFDVVFGLDNEAERTDLYLLEALMVDKSNPFRTRKAKFDISLFGAEAGDELHFNLEYNINLFNEQTIERFIKYFKAIVSSITTNINQQISEIDIIPDEERAMILYLFNDTEAEYSKDKTVQQLFEEVVTKRKNSIAVVGNNLETNLESSLSYKELNSRANQLAFLLRCKGLKPDQLAAIMVKPSVQMIIAMLAILKAGGGFLPIDYKIPGDRVKYMLEDSNVQLFLTCRPMITEIAYDAEMIEMDVPGLYYGEQHNPELVNKPNDLAYVIYTSGSTGGPKGVLGEHRPLINLCVWYIRYFKITPRDRATKFASFGFDASIWEVFPHLLSGSSLYIVPDDIKLDIDALNRFFEVNSITLSFLPTQMAEQFMTINNTSLRLLQAAGDKLKTYVKKKYQLYNCYGPTENTVCATSFLVKKFSHNIPIGKPIANNQIYILDKNGHLLPIGVPGELCVGGESVARGYMNNPHLTRQKFIENPYPLPIPLMQSPRLYCTGDLARWLHDGDIEFLGRIDYQVKIRGYRIELGEIENQLIHLEDITEVVVIAREDSSKQKYLCAYLVADKTIDISSLKRKLVKNLPDYMIPAYFMQLEQIPSNPNGKIDRKRLPEPELKRYADYTAPTNETETILAELWSEVLGIEKVSIDDNFFEIGGDSIKSILITGRLLKRQLSININDFFTNPTIRQAAVHVKRIRRKIDQGIIEGVVNLTPIQKWFFEKKFKEKNHFNHMVWLYSSQRFEKNIVKKVFAKIMEYHDALRMIYDIDENKVIQKNRSLKQGRLFDLKVLDFRNKKDADFDSYVKRINRSIHLQTGPLVKLGLFNTPTGDHLLVVIHHLVVDGVSWRILLEDFETGYKQAEKGEDIKFQDKTDSFKYWAYQLKQYANSAKALNELSYWKNIEETKPEVLPKDQQTGKSKKIFKNREVIWMYLDQKMTNQLLKEAHAAYNTEINDILLTALGMAVNEWSGIKSVLINQEGHGREAIMDDMDISRTVGWFTSQYPLLIDISPAPSQAGSPEKQLGFQIQKVKRSLREVPNKGIGYGILKYLTSPENKKGLTFQLKPEISFNYHGKLETEEDDLKKRFKVSLGNSFCSTFDMDCSLDIIGVVETEGLKFSIAYNKFEYHRSSIKKFVECYKSTLLRIIDHCVEKKKEIQALGLTGIEYHINKETEQYLEQVSREQWPDLTKENNYQHLLLTGATGFMGAFLTAELLEKTNATLYLPVRGKTPANSLERFQEKMAFYFGKKLVITNKNRLNVLHSDLSHDRIGLDSQQYKRLSKIIDAVIHPAANVKHHGLYENLHLDNVTATENLLAFAMNVKTKDFHYISTLDVGYGKIPGKEYNVFTEYCHDVGQESNHIYLKSKLAAEQLVLAYREKGLNGTIYRVGNLIFHSETGKFQENIEDDYFYAIVKGAAKLGIISSNMNKIVFDMSFINYIARATVLLLNRSQLKNQTYHLCNPHKFPMTEMVEILKKIGFELTQIKQEDVQNYFSNFAGNSEYEKIIERLKLHTEMFEKDTGTQTVYKLDRTVMLLKKLGFQWPKVTKLHIEKMISYCKRVGFL